MGLLEQDADNVVEALKRWVPPPSALTEKDFQDALYPYLNESFPKVTVHREWWNAKTKCDFYVDFKSDEGADVVVEVKCDLVDRNEFHRLLGQTLVYLKEWKREVVVVLCGDHDPALAKQAKVMIEFLGGACSKKARVVLAKHSSQ